MTTDERIIIRVRHRYAASAERVFDAFLDPAKAGKFMFVTPTGTITRCEIDARVGGRFNVTDRRDGEDVAHTGEYLEIDRPRRLVFSLFVEKYDQDADNVVIEIERQGSGCEVTLTHSISAAWADKRGQIEDGWSDILAGLAQTIGDSGAARVRSS